MTKYLSILIFFFTTGHISAQTVFTAAFYNTENLMDTLDNPHTHDNDFLPSGKNHWTSKRYQKKVSSIAKVISTIGDPDGPEVIGLAEVENREVLKDLVSDKSLKPYGYKIIHYDSPDDRGIDVALLYKPGSFSLISSSICSASFAKIKSHTRDVLLVKGVARKDTIHILVNHWPSRRSGKEESENKRIALAIVVREAIDSILQKTPMARIIVMGDFNDEPADKSIQVELNAKQDLTSVKKDELYNPFYNLRMKGQGSVNYSHSWNMFDQILLSRKFFTGKNFYTYKDAAVYHPDWMHYNKQLNKGPYRTFMGKEYKGGYSDHFPVYIQWEQR